MTRLNAWEKACGVVLLCAATAIVSPAQTFNTLVDFGGENGSSPLYMSLVQGRDGNFYGTTESGGVNNQGTVFRVSADGKLTTLYNFCSQANCPDGASPYAGLILASDGNFYGTTEGGGNDNCNPSPPSYGCGTVFRITPAGTLTTLHTFAGYPTDGAAPFAALMQATDGNLYGTTYYGGDQKCYLGYLNGCGTVFEITLGGTLTTMHNFDLQDGAWPAAGLIEAADGNFYGTTSAGGDQPSCGVEGLGCGTVFKMTPKGSLTSLHTFASDEGYFPYAGVAQAAGGNFYGTTTGSGLPPNFLGTAFKITPEGTLTTLYDFCTQNNCPDGGDPYAGLVGATDGNFYGTSSIGGTNCPLCGTVFKLTPTGELTTLHSFDFTDGFQPDGGLLQATNGSFYGSTYGGGTGSCTGGGCGTIFSLSVGLGPFVTFVRAAGKVGQTGGILGQGFTGTTSVSLNGISASFTVVSDTFIKATVPAGATTGYVTVTTPSGMLTSNVPFHVIK